MNKTDSNIIQLALDFPHRPSLGREDFLITSCNQEAASLVEQWPNWAYFALCIYGPSGCGKTHLANVFAANYANLTHHPYRIPFIRAEQLNLDKIHQLAETSQCLVIEDLEKLKNEEALFHLYNMYRDEGGHILFTSQEAPARLTFHLPDLRSRLNIIPTAEIKAPDDDLLSALLVKLFMDRQITPSPEIIKYILSNMQRSFHYAGQLVQEIDNISLSRKRAISIPLIKEAIFSLQKEPLQPSLF
ncbi:MAG: DNA replication protein [Alphaproteobacteria bacterium]|nr:DNA replication protein [Alphaproteobacteria bacterium]